MTESVPDDGKWAWVELSSYVVTAAQQNEPLTLRIGRREGNVEIDQLILSPVELTLSVAEPAGVMWVVGMAVAAGRRRRFALT